MKKMNKNKWNKYGTPALTSNWKDKMILKSKRSQEEMVGFALIVGIVAVVILVFLSFSLRAPEQEQVGSDELNNFISAVLHYNVDYENEIGDLIKDCTNYNENCDVLKTELSQILEKSWKVEAGSMIKGYNLNITSKDREVLVLDKGETTKNNKITTQTYSDSEITFTVYY